MLNKSKKKETAFRKKNKNIFLRLRNLKLSYIVWKNAKKKDKEGRIDSLEEDLKTFSQIELIFERQIDELLEFSLRKNEGVS